jgi:hypothetical protein
MNSPPGHSPLTRQRMTFGLTYEKNSVAISNDGPYVNDRFRHLELTCRKLREALEIHTDPLAENCLAAYLAPWLVESQHHRREIDG